MLIFSVSFLFQPRVLSVRFEGQPFAHLIEKGSQRLTFHPVMVQDLVKRAVTGHRQSAIQVRGVGLPMIVVSQYYDFNLHAFIFRGRTLVSEMSEHVWFTHFPERKLAAVEKMKVTKERRKQERAEQLEQMYRLESERQLALLNQDIERGRPTARRAMAMNEQQSRIDLPSNEDNSTINSSGQNNGPPLNPSHPLNRHIANQQGENAFNNGLNQQRNQSNVAISTPLNQNRPLQSVNQPLVNNNGNHNATNAHVLLHNGSNSHVMDEETEEEDDDLLDLDEPMEDERYEATSNRGNFGLGDPTEVIVEEPQNSPLASPFQAGHHEASVPATSSLPTTSRRSSGNGWNLMELLHSLPRNLAFDSATTSSHSES